MSFPSWIAQSAHASGSLVAKSAVITISSGGARFVGSFVTAIMLGRLLSPDDFGLVGMVMPIIAVVGILSDGGVSNHTLQTKELDQQNLSLTFWIGAILSFFLFLLLALSSPLIANIYDDDRLQLLTVVVSTSLLLAIFNTQHNALVKRCFKHNYFAYAEIAGSLSGTLAGVSMAYLGGGYWSIAAVPLVRSLVHGIMIWLLTGWVPKWPKFQIDKAKEILSFGGYVIFSHALGTGLRNLDKVILGMKYNAQEVGYYAMAFNIMMLPVFQILTPAGSAIVPYFAQIREDKERFKNAITRITGYLGCIIAPPMAFAAVNSEELLTFVLGEKWMPSAEIFSLLGYAVITGSITMPLNWAMVASGHPAKLARWTTYIAVPIVFAYLVGSNWGGYGVAAGYLLFTLANLIALPIYCSRFLGIEPVLFLANSLKTLAIAGLVAVIQYMAKDYLNEHWSLSAITSLLLKLLILMLSLLAIVPIFAHGILQDMKAILNKRHTG